MICRAGQAFIAWGAAGVMLCVGMLANAEQPTPTPAPSPTPYPTSLSEYAKQIKLKKPTGTTKQDGGIVISDQDIDPERLDPDSDKFKDQPVGEAKEQPEQDKSEKDKKAQDREKKKEMWQQRYREQQDQIDKLEAELSELNRKIPELQNQFYSWDDPFYRDGVIKPELDAAMARRDEVQKQLPQAREGLTKVVNDARRDGALPGWFRGLDKSKK